jgi:hypothetical protein
MLVRLEQPGACNCKKAKFQRPLPIQHLHIHLFLSSSS